MCIVCSLSNLSTSLTEAIAQLNNGGNTNPALMQTNASGNTAASTAGSSGIGDSLYPTDGNGGYDVIHYDLDLNVTDVATGMLQGKTTFEATATQALSSFNLDFVGFEIDSLVVNGQPAEFSRDGNELTVIPPTGLVEGEAFTVEVNYNGSPEQITSVAIPILNGWILFDGGSYVLAQPDGAPKYFPNNNHPLDKATYSFKVTVPEGFDVAANGLLEQTIDNGETITYQFEARDPMASYLATVNIVNDFRVESEIGPDGVIVRNYFDKNIPEEELQPFDLQPEMIEYFSSIFGPYPFEAYGSVVVNEALGAALETQTLSIFGTDFFAGDRLETVIAHELAHQWFGDSVSVADWKDIWLNESFATYSQGLWEEESRGDAALDTWIEGRYARVDTNIQAGNYTQPGNPRPDNLFNGSVYSWGGLSLHALRLQVGDDDFFETLQTYHSRFENGNATTADFIGVAEEISGQQLESFFDRWLFSDYLAPITELGLVSTGTTAGTAGKDTLIGSNTADDVMYGGGDDDTVAGGLGDDIIFGEFGDDVLRGDRNNGSPQNHLDGDDTIYGGAGSDRIGGKGGDDKLYGDEDNDFIWGDAGDDLLWGGRGDDHLYGGRGNDTFVLAKGEGTDIVYDFGVGNDVFGLAGDLTFEELSFTVMGTSTQISASDELLAEIANFTTALSSADFMPVA